MNYTDRINSAIENAKNGVSKLNEDCLLIEGCSSPKIRHLLNNLVTSEDRYLEIGCFKGSTSIAALYPNECSEYFLIDNYSQFDIALGSDKTKEEFLNNFKRIIGHPPKNFINQGSFDINPAEFNVKDINVYLYDGQHDRPCQKAALVHYYDCLCDEFIFCVDDWDSEWGVRNGTQDAIDELKLKVIHKVELPAGKICDSKLAHTDDAWWFGFAVFHLKK